MPLQLNLDLEPLPPVTCHAARVNQVVMNLLSNAIKFTPRAWPIRLFVPPGRPTCLAVQDEGSGEDPRPASDLLAH